VGPGPPEGAAPPPGRAAIARRLRERLGPAPQRAEWPAVSIVVVNRDGEEHLGRLLPLLASATDYPQLELVLVDNASEDDSVEFARAAELPFPLTVLRNDENLSFSDANNDGVEAARFDLLLLLNNDVEPFEPGWLKELVECLERNGTAAAGATLLHAENYRGHSRADYVLQHRGVELAQEAGRLIPLNVGDGEDLARWEPVDTATPALTAACLLLRRDAFDLAGGLTTGFRWGWEDVDLGLKLASAGETMLCSGRSLLFHHTSSTRFRRGQEWRRSTRAHNQRLLYERWGPQLRREYLLDRLAGTGFWTDGRPPRLAVAGSRRPAADRAARELADAVEEEGWRVTLVEPSGGGWGEIPEDADFVLLADPSLAAELPPDLACIAWVDDEEVDIWADAPVLRRAELTLVAHLRAARTLEAAGVAPVLFQGAAEAGRLIGLLRERVQRLRFCLKLSRDWELEPAALALRRGLEQREHACALQLADEWELLGGTAADVAVACGEPGSYRTKPAQVNVLWAAGEVRPTKCDQWDLVLVPGEQAAAALAAETPTLVVAFDPGSVPDPAERLLELAAHAAARDGVQARVAAHA
jgi:GT2 family glycosyltransferase